ncbi:MAG: serine--tRNA ligase [Candidatus Zixiibacteriota bacterium]|nr:MAG: serine--tRNA ligase [candidate division Zixibacteria bacterium]
MLDLKFVRENADLVRNAVENKNETADVNKVLELDEKRRAIIGEVENLKALRNKVSEQIAIKKKNKEDASEDIAQMKEVGEKIAALDGDLRSVKEALEYRLIRIPNIPHESVPVGRDEESNVTVREWGKIPQFDFKPLPHWEIGEKFDLLDLPAAAKITGSGFYVLKGIGARLERALICFMLDTHIADGFIEVAPPFVANADAMTGCGQLPKLAEDMYQLKDESLYLVPTAEVPVTNLHREEVLSADQLPLYYVAYTPCFRREAGAAGKDTRGTLRVHQFDKVEMVKIVHPDNSYEEHESLLKQAEKIVQMLEIPYRVRLLATGDLSFAAAKCYDIEIWEAGVDKYLEISSVSIYEDFQARRMNCRFRDRDGKIRFVHTLNGSGLALARLTATILENYQTEYGTIVIPEVLRPYMGGLAEITDSEQQKK